MRTHRNKHQRSLSLTLEDENEGCPSPDAGSAAESDVESSGGDTFKLILRSAVTSKDITLTVRPTTTCGAIVKAFLKSAGLAAEYSTGGTTPKKRKKADKLPQPMLQVDGEKMNWDDEIGNAELEDGDMVDVVGL